MKYGLLNYEDTPDGRFNIGDHIQSLAAEQYLPSVDKLILRDRLNTRIGEPVKMIMNGWYTHRPKNWPPTEEIDPLFVSFHLNSFYTDEVLSKPENITYLKKHGPIGCRDYSTLNALKKYGIAAYYSFCLTTTLDYKYKAEESERTNEILMVDVLYKDNLNYIYSLSPKKKYYHMLNGKYFKRNHWKKKIESLIPKDILAKAIYLTQGYRSMDIPEEKRFDYARKLLNKYARAKLVITSRIHCALPCLALGTPVVFVHGGGLNKESEISRLSGTIDHLNVLIADEDIVTDEAKKQFPNLLIPGKFDWNQIQNPTTYRVYADKLKQLCIDFINQL